MRAAIAAVGMAVAVLLFLPIFPGPKDDGGGRVGGASAIGALFSGRQGWDSKGYYSELVTLAGVGEIKPGTVFTGAQLTTVFGSDKQYAGLDTPWSGSTGTIPLPGSTTPPGAKKPAAKKPKSKSYGRNDVVSYTVTGINKSGTHATVSGTAVMRDGAVKSGSVYMEKVNNKWKVVGYGM